MSEELKPEVRDADLDWQYAKAKSV